MTAARVLGIDPGQQCGYAWTSTGSMAHGHSGVWQLGKVAKLGRRFDLLFERLEGIEPTHIAYERPFSLRGKPAQTWHYGYLAIVHFWCERSGVPIREVNPVELKRFATGSAKADKDAMRAALLERRPWIRVPRQASDDQVDAIWVAEWGLEAFGLVAKRSAA